ncbi:MAG: exonuclease domain-containing protein [Sulfuricella sp.]|nr:exonuclease domain-containing protein [Sulfuricella sp.]
MNPLDQPLVFVDLETTGANAAFDRITEIGIVEVDQTGVREWSTLVNPGELIPEFIQRLTGITNAMVADAPPFEDVAEEALARLRGRLFVAHNARFDYGFLRSEFKRLGIAFSATVLCTVKLSRRMFPQHHKHNLDALIERHNLPMENRHRALADAKALWFFMRHLAEVRPEQAIAEAIAAITQRPALPAHLDPAIIDDLPETFGAYLFYGENDLPLYIGKSNNIRKRVLSHFSADLRHAGEMALSRQLRRIEWIETAGELGALLTESRLIKQLQPLHNRRLRQNSELCSWLLVEDDDGALRPRLGFAAEMADFGREPDLYGLFTSRKNALATLRNLADGHRLCHAKLGLEAPAPDKPCFAYQLEKCRGACIDLESIASHNLRLMEAMAKSRVQAWPFKGMVGIRETAPLNARTDLHLVENWGYLGTVGSEEELRERTERRGPAHFDLDIYKILGKHLRGGKLEIVPLE